MGKFIRYKFIKGHPDYMIFSDGRVYSLKSQKVIKAWNKKGRKAESYRWVSFSEKGKVSKEPVRRLVVGHFIGDIEGKVINHLDGNPENNNVSNLEICTVARNTQHAFDTGLNNNFGENHYMVKLTLVEVKEIMLLKGYLTQKKIAEMYGMCRQSVSDIFRGKSWSRALKDE